MGRCDEAALFGQRRHKRLLRSKTSAAMQKQNGMCGLSASIE
jgi:hypothetical protein